MKKQQLEQKYWKTKRKPMAVDIMKEYFFLKKPALNVVSFQTEGFY